MEPKMKKKAEIDLIFQPNLARIERILPQIAEHRLFQLRFVDEDVVRAFSHAPGQFVEVTVLGVGEAPISISSPPTRPGIIEICVRKAGSSLLQAVLDDRASYGDLVLMYGARNPDDILFKYELLGLMNRTDIKYLLSVDVDEEGIWRQYIGVVTGLFERVELNPENTFCGLCGPPIMYRFVVQELLKRDIPTERIFVSLERMMQCGLGKCGHCAIGEYYCCTDGPVFKYSEISHIKEAI